MNILTNDITFLTALLQQSSLKELIPYWDQISSIIA